MNGPVQTCINCNCNKNGSLNDICSYDGICSCKANVTGDKCTYCDLSLFPFPYCDKGENMIHTYSKIRLIRPFFFIIECNCDSNGSNSSSCDSDGMCTCKPNFTGSKCTECLSGFFGFPECKGKIRELILIKPFYEKISWFQKSVKSLWPLDMEGKEGKIL